MIPQESGESWEIPVWELRKESEVQGREQGGAGQGLREQEGLDIEDKLMEE